MMAGDLKLGTMAWAFTIHDLNSKLQVWVSNKGSSLEHISSWLFGFFTKLGSSPEAQQNVRALNLITYIIKIN